ncbi:uncharacterized protein LOC112600795 [Melanaphis sacchari]|uniref:uncharacterized protein LOC112600795 n=1 Tax=Melanaphis sacchari TaxID=742174 RepID=UPI000DC14FC6|nr:uncharacterized protein LOC112600795 [Melanaphis sacchari]
MSFIVHYVAFLSLAFVVVMSELQYPNESLQYLNKIDNATKSHDDNINFLKTVMEVDYLWWPILNETVRVKRPKIEYFDPYANEAPNGDLEDMEVLPLKNITTLLASNVFVGTDVQLTMDVLKTATACSVLKHISFQGIVFHHLLKKHSSTIPYEERMLFLRWLLDMVHVAVDKLAALDYSLLLITSMHKRLAEIHLSFLNNKTDLDTESLHEIGLDMFTEINNKCVVPEGEEGHYSSLIADLNRIKRIEDLKAHRSLITETMRDSTDIIDIDIMNKIKGEIIINKNIDANGIDTLNESVLKRAYGANYVQMNFLFLNLPIYTLAESQWNTLFKLEKSMQ